MVEREAGPVYGGKVAVVTGSTRGIGLAVAEAVVRGGGRVMVSSRTESRVRDAVARLAESSDGGGAGGPSGASGESPDVGGGSEAVAGRVCDVRDPEACAALVNGAVERFGGLDILVNNAGLGRFASIQEMDLETWNVQIRTNLDGVFHCSKAAIPHLVERGGGWIFNIGSLAGRNAFAGGVAYNASKWGLLGMTEAMMLDLRHEGIRVSCIMPGSVNTHFFPGGPHPQDDWKLRSEDIARVITDLLAFPERALPSKVEIRPSRPPRS